ncbi:hydroxyacylglutathione hydrolase [Rhodospirillum rubrum]|uniref:Hydroxyacylglutathione hydrolase n=1 Tax=Rhodospirillum rubrum (strain ATCC 11170 / ATH 1.1.1 / DSM 467 / LMG 4362 / NCIMB 8255 / S1) TaxID=269796 RepID=GLO2_RHORT|nr:hydroxyacylglutathione hydrolase [Rhodospirillum rubrum]Q2RP80.1 RecName: Full=Hydroxyacylglutathione hydrolase; AltName: Full=Glyoxalase II; Short=Glx II [Rhodospirillum rubrum ATCC 11170]ABC24065.1 Hydroxyacylglutathione hydrolase [Rhodospirillum rubrum ATCC 11170]AEO49811.1 hydroxyacylglutathione hydrolase [Rhodospirillum rubrum F11]MBK5955750.1 hydroxyacylglutathione hydrolase [Rhodospirillum rubrum]QXG80008.1 hydroxyacylglutathione hydrolase [Rhodospirillum rubrum]HAP99333.1 hydroxyac
MSTLDIHQIAVLSDNYIYLVRCRATGACAVIDPSLAEPVLAAAESLGWTITHILNTHHHYDHTGGNEEIKAATGCEIIGFAGDAHRLPGIDRTVVEGDRVAIGQAEARVIETPGHTLGHIAYWFAESSALFCGDTLFSAGCGRLFEGSAGQMWDSLRKLRALPAQTLVFCGHEYTQPNITFALTIDPRNEALRARALEVDALRAAGRPTVPAFLGDEARSNPFLRADSADFQEAFGMTGADPVEVFARTRLKKDHF